MNKKEAKIRKLLGDRFHLCVEYNENLEIKEWHLFRKYKETVVYFSPDNKEIMSSDKNTIEELYKFAKSHRKTEEHFYLSKSRIYIAWFFMVLVIVNILFINSKYISGIILGADLILISESIISYTIWNKNFNVDQLELYEELERIEKRIQEKKELIKDEKTRCGCKSTKQNVDR